MTKPKLTIAPEPPPAAHLEDMSKDELVSRLREFMSATRDLCDAAEDYLSLRHPEARPQLHVIPGGKAARK